MYRRKWAPGDTYNKIAESYAKLVFENYLHATVVFNGYSNGPTVKDQTHQRRAKIQNNKQVPIMQCNTVYEGGQDELLTDHGTKSQLIQLVSQHLSRENCDIVQADGDADVSIVLEAVKAAAIWPTFVIGEDTDLLVLLLYHATGKENGLWLRSDRARSKDSCLAVHDILDIKRKLPRVDDCRLYMLSLVVTLLQEYSA